MMRAISFILLLASTALAQSPDQQITSGIAAFHKGNYAEARSVLAKFPNDPQARTFLALASAGSGKCAEAEPDLQQQFASNPDPELRRMSGLALVQCYLSRNEFDRIFPVLTALERVFPKDADVLYECAKVFNRAWNDAVQRMFQAAPSSFRLNQLSAEVFEIEGRYAEAISEYRKAISKNPQALNLHYRLGRALLLQSHTSEALQQASTEFEAELSLNSSDAAAEYQLGQILLAEQKSSEAAARFENAAALDSNFPEALVALGRVRMESKRYEEAIQLLQRAIQLRPKMESAHYSLMLAYRNSGRADDARREKAELDQLQRPPEGEFSEFLKKLGAQAPPKQ
jgi:tetratricopeptide (TPR) repeat protein